MRKETQDMLARARLRNADLEATLERAADRARKRTAARPPKLAAAPSLPVAEVSLFTFTETELHDLAYHAVSTYLAGLSGMTRAKAHQHAARIASRAMVAALASDAHTRGADPRA